MSKDVPKSRTFDGGGKMLKTEVSIGFKGDTASITYFHKFHVRRFTRAESQRLVSNLKNLSSVRTVSVEQSTSTIVAVRGAGKPSQFQADVIRTVQELFTGVPIVPYDEDTSKNLIGTKHRAHIMYITDRGRDVTQAVIILPGKITTDVFDVYEQLKQFEKFGDAVICKDPFRVHISVVSTRFERRFVPAVAEYFNVDKVVRCNDIVDANKRGIRRLR